MDIRSRGKRRAIAVTTAIGLAGLATTIAGSALLWNDTAQARSAISGTVNNQGSDSDAADHYSSSDDDVPTPDTNTRQLPLLTPSQGGAVQGRSSGS